MNVLMETEALKEKILEKIPDAIAGTSGEWLQMELLPHQWPGTAQWLRDEKDLYFDFLFCLTCIDWLKHLTMVYHVTSTKYRHNLVIKVNLDREKPQIGSVAGIWRTADFHEREVYEMYGVQFIGHPDLRKLILPDDWEGYPMRKDYDDPVNMIKL